MTELYHAGQPIQQSLFSDVDYIELQQLALFDPENPIDFTQASTKLKRCSKCKEYKDLDEFYRSKNAKPDGIDHNCKDCRKEYNINYRKEHGDPRSLDPIRREAHYRQQREKRLRDNPPPVPPKPGHKVCNECQAEKPFEAFNKSADIKDGYAGKCKECTRAYHQKYRETEMSKPPQSCPDFKVCRACGEEKPIDQYHMAVGKPIARCKDCVRAYDRSRDLQYNPRKKPPKRHATKEGYKVCAICSIEKRFAEFNKNAQQKDGYSSKCRNCMKELWEKRTPEEKKSQRERRYQLEEARRDAIRAYDQVRLHTPQRQTARRNHANKRKAIINGNYAEEVDYQRVLEREGYHCYICNQDILPHHRLAFDHFVPLIPRNGDPIGTHTEDNLYPTHRECNARKSNRKFEDLTDFDKRGPNS